MEIMMKFALLCVAAAIGVLWFASCNDKMSVQQAYDFTLSHWYLQPKIHPGETVEIRFTLSRSGNFSDAVYYIGYTQMAGRGEVLDADGQPLTNRETYALASLPGLRQSQEGTMEFTLFYRNLGERNTELKFQVLDNFNQQYALPVSFEVEATDPI